MKRPKLLAPAGNMIALQAALDAGADEIYFGVQGLNMRAGAKNFSLDDMAEIVRRCTEKGVRPLLTLNVITYDNEQEMVVRILEAAVKAGIDTIIAWDMGVIAEATKRNMRIHLSTQASVSNAAAILHYATLIPNLERVVLARECSLEDVQHIAEKVAPIEIETFVHGAMCVSISGRCFMSQDLFGKSANRGECLQPCRREYKIYDSEEKKSMLLGNEYIMSPQDLCVLPFIEKLLATDIACFKIEGRNRSPEYVKTVVQAYKQVLDAYGTSEFEQMKTAALQQVETVYNRGFSSGFYMGKPINAWCKSYGSKATQSKQLVGTVCNYFSQKGVAEISVQSHGFRVGDTVLIMGKTTGVVEAPVTSIREQEQISEAKKGMHVTIQFPPVRKGDAVYVIVHR